MKVEEYGKDNPKTIVMLHGAFLADNIPFLQSIILSFLI